MIKLGDRSAQTSYRNVQCSSGPSAVSSDRNRRFRCATAACQLVRRSTGGARMLVRWRKSKYPALVATQVIALVLLAACSSAGGPAPGNGAHLATGGVWQRPPPLPRRRRCQLWKRELDCVRGYSQGAQIGSPSRNRWREQGQAEPICPYLETPAAAATRPLERAAPGSLPRPTPVRSAPSARPRRHSWRLPGQSRGCRLATRPPAATRRSTA